MKTFGEHQVIISYIPEHVPFGSAEEAARYNYQWPKAMEVAEMHKAHVLVIVSATRPDVDPITTASTLTKFVDTALNQESASGVFTDWVLYPPEYYCHMAQALKEGELPVADWIWFGIGKDKKDVPGVYTNGLRKFGRDEIEVYAEATWEELIDFLYKVVDYELSANTHLKNKQTIGFEPGQYLKIKKSRGVNVKGKTLKIEYPGEVR